MPRLQHWVVHGCGAVSVCRGSADVEPFGEFVNGGLSALSETTEFLLSFDGEFAPVAAQVFRQPVPPLALPSRHLPHAQSKHRKALQGSGYATDYGSRSAAMPHICHTHDQDAYPHARALVGDANRLPLSADGWQTEDV